MSRNFNQIDFKITIHNKLSNRKPKKMIRALNPNKTAKISERKAEGKQEERCMDEDSRISPSLSRAIQAEVIEEGNDSLAGWKEPSVYKDCTEGGKTSSSILSLKKGEREGEADKSEFVK
ncbi:hypothetical protein RIR_jg14889.t1 [Rhizophagus irregularis DAOM 181602=DAOM 197198]|nr:hypothetical protein RIR_jg14889.t1 [Rhizophagus irregularis DAOM 181602=DAOM 197198]